ncbi:terpene synthase family protein [Streptomyces sp. NPDC057638]|uniref:terpene synthase family protein n=1 Tax=Streptomyces sp. NPDC057638 TaxID=3346190 RepID=UPI0036D09ECB
MTGPPPEPPAPRPTAPWSPEALPDATRRLHLPYRRHRHAAQLEQRARHWAAENGLATGPAASRLRAHGLDRLASVVMAEERDAHALLYARWLIWVFCLDDHIESATAPEEIDALFGGLLTRTEHPARAPHDRTGEPARVIETALALLWQESGRCMSHHWQERFRRHLREQRTGCLSEHHLRRAHTVPTAEEYPLLRRRSSGLWLYDLPEAVLGIELPSSFAAMTLWRDLVCRVSDAANLCNDILSCSKEAADQLTMNALLVARHRLGLTGAAAVHWVTGHIVDHLDHAAALGREIPGAAAGLGLPPRAVRDVSRVACAVLNFPAAYLAWALDSARYTEPTGAGGGDPEPS